MIELLMALVTLVIACGGVCGVIVAIDADDDSTLLRWMFVEGACGVHILGRLV